MRITGVEAGIAHYREAGTKKNYAQSELRTNGERTTRGFTVPTIRHGFNTLHRLFDIVFNNN